MKVKTRGKQIVYGEDEETYYERIQRLLKKYKEE